MCGQNTLKRLSKIRGPFLSLAMIYSGEITFLACRATVCCESLSLTQAGLENAGQVTVARIIAGTGNSERRICRALVTSPSSIRGELFSTLREAQVLIERGRIYYNTARLHSALGYRPPAPRTVLSKEVSSGQGEAA